MSEKTWFYINALSNELKIKISKLESKTNFNIDCEVFIHILL